MVDFTSITGNRFILHDLDGLIHIQKILADRGIAHIVEDGVLVVGDADCDKVDGLLYEAGLDYTQD